MVEEVPSAGFLTSCRGIIDQRACFSHQGLRGGSIGEDCTCFDVDAWGGDVSILQCFDQTVMHLCRACGMTTDSHRVDSEDKCTKEEIWKGLRKASTRCREDLDLGNNESIADIATLSGFSQQSLSGFVSGSDDDLL